MQEFDAELEAVGAEEAAQQAAAGEAALAAEQEALQQLQAAADELAAQEQQYWHAFNDFHLQLCTHVEERDALLNKARTGSSHATCRVCPARLGERCTCQSNSPA